MKPLNKTQRNWVLREVQNQVWAADQERRNSPSYQLKMKVLEKEIDKIQAQIDKQVKSLKEKQKVLQDELNSLYRNQYPTQEVMHKLEAQMLFAADVSDMETLVSNAVNEILKGVK
jgi:hypothetical protein